MTQNIFSLYYKL